MWPDRCRGPVETGIWNGQCRIIGALPERAASFDVERPGDPAAPSSSQSALPIPGSMRASDRTSPLPKQEAHGNSVGARSGHARRQQSGTGECRRTEIVRCLPSAGWRAPTNGQTRRGEERTRTCGPESRSGKWLTVNLMHNAISAAGLRGRQAKSETIRGNGFQIRFALLQSRVGLQDPAQDPSQTTNQIDHKI